MWSQALLSMTSRVLREAFHAEPACKALKVCKQDRQPREPSEPSWAGQGRHKHLLTSSDSSNTDQVHSNPGSC